MTSKLYVGNLAYSVKDADLSQLFSGCGTVASSRVVTDPQTGRSKGFAFVEMSDDEGAQKAIAELNGKDFQGRNLKVNEAKPREDRPPRDR